MRDNKRKTVVILILLLLLLLLISLIGIFIYRERVSKENVNEDISSNDYINKSYYGEDNSNNKSNTGDNIGTPVKLDDSTLNKLNRDLTLERDRRRGWKLSTPDRDINFNARYDENFKETNTVLYQIVQRYFCKDNFKDTQYSSDIDPLYIMAISNVEFGSISDERILLAPALPTNKGIVINKDTLANFGYAEYLNYPKVLSEDRDEYRGPLQLFVTGLMPGIVPNDLTGSEYSRLLNAPDSEGKMEELNSLSRVEGSGIGSSVDGMRLTNQHGTYGDRFNYGDAVNRLSGTIKWNWIQYTKSGNGIDKSGNNSIDNMYSWMAMSAIGHNSSPGIFYVGDSKTLSYYWWPFHSFQSAREYCHYLGQDQVVEYIKNLAYDNVQHGNKNFRISREQGVSIAEQFVAKGLIPDTLWKINNWNNEEKVAYPIQVLYNYFCLCAIYGGM